MQQTLPSDIAVSPAACECQHPRAKETGHALGTWPQGHEGTCLTLLTSLLDDTTTVARAMPAAASSLEHSLGSKIIS